jgi:hypothetical protein
MGRGRKNTVLDWAADFLSQPWPALTFAVLLALAAVAYRPVARRLGWPAWATFGALVSLAVVLTLTLPPAPDTMIDDPGQSGVGGCVGSLFDPQLLWRAVTATTDRGERVGNVLMFMPLTFFAVLASRRPALVATGGVLLPVVIEVSQSIMDVGRECVGYDWVNNAIGAVLGVIVGAATIGMWRAWLHSSQ